MNPKIFYSNRVKNETEIAMRRHCGVSLLGRRSGRCREVRRRSYFLGMFCERRSERVFSLYPDENESLPSTQVDFLAEFRDRHMPTEFLRMIAAADTGGPQRNNRLALQAFSGWIKRLVTAREDAR